MAARRKRRPGRPSGEEMELQVERLVNGPGSMAHAADGRVVFLDDGLPGERVRAQVQSEHKGFLRARVVRALDPPSVERRSPPCEVVALCGGCPWQALEYPAQVEAKSDLVVREVTRATGAAPDDVPAPIVGPEWRSRHRIRLGVKVRAHGEPLVGYRGRGAHEIVPIEDCVIAREDLASALPLARLVAAEVKSVREIELSVDDASGIRVRASCAQTRAPEVDAIHGAVSERARSVDFGGGRARYAGIVLESSDASHPWRVEAGNVDQTIQVSPELAIRVPVGAFTQVNADLNARLVEAVVEAVACGPDRRVVDLFCGAGNFSLPLARAGATVVGLDSDARAIDAASAEASAQGLAVRTRFEVGSAELETVARLLEGAEVDALVLDPPRAGAAAALPAILAARPPVLVYVSCDIATFGRDARRIVEAGWGFSSLRLIDLTPQTYRAEVLGVFRLTWERGSPYRDR